MSVSLPWITLVIVFIALIGVASFYYSAAKHLLFELQIHDLAIRAHELRHSQIKRLMELRGADGWESAELVMDPSIEQAVESLAQSESHEAVDPDDGAALRQAA